MGYRSFIIHQMINANQLIHEDLGEDSGSLTLSQEVIEELNLILYHPQIPVTLTLQNSHPFRGITEIISRSSFTPGSIQLIALHCPLVKTLQLIRGVFGSTQQTAIALTLFPHLQKLQIHFYQKQLNQAIKILSKLKSLRHLDLKSEQIKNQNLNNLCQRFKGLTHLRLHSFCSNVKKSLSSLKRLEGLVSFSLVRSVVSYDLIDSVAELEGLEVLEFVDCQLPEFTYGWKYLRTLERLKVFNFLSDVILRGKRMIDILPEFPLLEEISLSFKNQKHFDSSFYDKYPKLRTLKGQQLLLFSKGEIMMAQGVTRLELRSQMEGFTMDQYLVLFRDLPNHKNILSILIDVNHPPQLIPAICVTFPNLEQLSLSTFQAQSRKPRLLDRHIIILKTLKHLYKLYLYSPQITPPSLFCLVKNFKKLTTLSIPKSLINPSKHRNNQCCLKNLFEISDCRLLLS